jgi:hypothetical protein
LVHETTTNSRALDRVERVERLRPCLCGHWCLLFIADHWHFVETKWSAVSVIVEVAISVIALSVFGLVVRTASSLFWPVMYALVAWHRERAAKRDATMVPRKENAPATFSSNLRSELFMAARLLLWGVLGFGILWGIRACSKAIVEPDRHPPAYYDPNP